MQGEFLALVFCAVRDYFYRYAATLLLLPFLGVSSLDLGPLVQTSGLLSFWAPATAAVQGGSKLKLCFNDIFVTLPDFAPGPLAVVGLPLHMEVV